MRLVKFDKYNSLLGDIKTFEEFVGNKIGTSIQYSDVTSLDEYREMFEEILENGTDLINIKRAVFEDKLEVEVNINQFLSNSGMNGVNGMLSVQMYSFDNKGYEDRLYKVYSAEESFGECSVVDKIELYYNDKSYLSRIIKKLKSESNVKNVVYKLRPNNNIKILVTYKSSSAKIN